MESDTLEPVNAHPKSSARTHVRLSQRIEGSNPPAGSGRSWTCADEQVARHVAQRVLFSPHPTADGSRLFD